jgi:hypothetical protein
VLLLFSIHGYESIFSKLWMIYIGSNPYLGEPRCLSW